MSGDRATSDLPPILADKEFTAPSIFEPANLLREARRQKGLTEAKIPEICILDPDGDILRWLRRAGRASLSPAWACYHTELYEFDHGGEHFGIIGCAVGASFAVLLAEQFFASGCRFLVSVTSAGQIVSRGATPYFVVIDRALRDEGTSYHYLPPSEFCEADAALVERAMAAWKRPGAASTAARRGRPMRRSARPQAPSNIAGRAASWRSKWRRRRFMPLRGLGTSRCYVWRMSQTRWRSRVAISKRARPAAPLRRLR